MRSTTVHLAELGSYTGNRCRSAWDGEKYDEPDPVTGDVDEITCKPCRARMLADGQCPRCGEYGTLAWSPHPKKLTGVADGRLTMNDVTAVFYLACEYCSETLIPEVDLDAVARFLTAKRFRP